MARETALLIPNQDCAIMLADNPNNVRWVNEFANNGRSWMLMVIMAIAASIAGYCGPLFSQLKIKHVVLDRL